MIGEFVPYELASKLKQLGFDEEGFGMYGKNGSVLPLVPYTSEDKAIIFQQAFRWFREIHALDGFFDRIGTTYIYKIRSWKNESTNSFSTYEEAELACLEKLIEIVETKKQEQ